LPLFEIELRLLAVPACSPVTVFRLTQLNSSNGRTAWIFQILLTVQARSWWRQQQLLTCCFVQVFEFGTWKIQWEIGYKNVRHSLPVLCLRLNKKKRNFFFYIRGDSALPAVQFTVPVFLGFTFHKNLELRRETKVADLLSMKPLGAPWINWWAIHGTVRSVADCRHCTKLFRLLFECSDSTSVLTSDFIIMCKWHGVSSENLVVMQVHWGTIFTFLLEDAESC